MKIGTSTILLLATSANAFTASFAPRTESSVSSSALNLFGGKKEKGEGGPGMMDQLAMLKKAQEIASKKMEIDKELATIDHVGVGADGKVSITIKYIAPAPMQQPGYEPLSVDIDEAWMSEASVEDLNAALSTAMKDGLTKATTTTAEKMQVLTAELGEVMGSMGGGVPPS